MTRKITIVGGGSYTWGPQFIRDIALLPDLHDSKIVLFDIDPEALDLVYSVGKLALEKMNVPVTLEKTLDQTEALTDADFVILTITTGKLKTMRVDLEVPEKYGIWQSVGDTVGPGGLSRGLRNIPVVVDIACHMEEVCPDAWLLNYTNPLTTLTQAVTRETKIRTI